MVKNTKFAIGSAINIDCNDLTFPRIQSMRDWLPDCLFGDGDPGNFRSIRSSSGGRHSLRLSTWVKARRLLRDFKRAHGRPVVWLEAQST